MLRLSATHSSLHTVFFRLNAAAFISFSAFPMWRLFEGGVCFEITFLKSLTTVTVNRFLNIMYRKGSNLSSYFAEIES